MIDYVVKNIKSTIVMYITNYILKFVQRSVFISSLPITYLGLNGLFNDILMVLSITEMGVGSAIAYSLYKPLSTNNISELKAIMALFKKVYHLIGCSIFFIGISITPFIGLIVKDKSIQNMEYFFLIILFTNAIGYFYSYKWVLLTADRKGYIFNYYHTIFLITSSIFQIVLLELFKSYWLFLLITFITRVVENYYITKKINSMYPFIMERNASKISAEIKKTIIKNIKALLLNKLSVMINNSSFSILASKYIGLSIVGLYSNYYLIISAITIFCAKIFKSLTAIIGNFMITSKYDSKLKVFNFLFYIAAWIGTVIFSILYIGLNDLINIWLGNNMLMPEKFVVLLLLVFYVNFMQNVVTLFKESAGLYWEDRYRAVIEVVLNIIFAIYLVQQYGVYGILGANLISKLLASFWIEPYILLNRILKMPIKTYFFSYFKYTIIIFSVMGLNSQIVQLLFGEITWFVLLLKVSLCFIVSNLIWLVLFRHSAEMCYLKQILYNKFRWKYLQYF